MAMELPEAFLEHMKDLLGDEYEAYLESGELQQIALNPAIPSRRMLAVIHQNLPLSAAGTRFLQMMEIDV